MAKITSIVVEVTNDEESKEVQRILFDSGCLWTNNIKYVKLYHNSDNLPAIYSNYDGKLYLKLNFDAGYEFPAIYTSNNGRMSYADRDFYTRHRGIFPHNHSYSYGEFMAKYDNHIEKLYKALKNLKE